MSMHPLVKEFFTRLLPKLKTAFKGTAYVFWFCAKFLGMLAFSVAFVLILPIVIGHLVHAFVGLFAFVVCLVTYGCVFSTLEEMDKNPLMDMLLAMFGDDDDY